MKVRPLSWVAEAVGGRLVGPETRVGPGVVIDSRQARAGALFVALPGERADGHDFVAAAADRGAAAALTTREMGVLPEVVVDDGVQALTRLARAVVADAHADGLAVVAVTGSSGKTSTKDILAQLLETTGETVSPVGSFNNEIGVPLTACAVTDETRYLVSEMGARGKGHIAWLCDIVRPDISMVLNVGSAHLGEFGSVEGIALAKGEIVEALADDGCAVLNLDAPRVAAMRERTRARVAWFTTGDAAAPEGSELVVRARITDADEFDRHSFTLVVERGDDAPESFDVTLPLMGAHQVANAAAAATAAIVAGVSPAAVAEALGRLGNRSPWRMQLDIRPDGAAIINDAYNANPDSMRAALQTLAGIAEARRRSRPGGRVHVVLGDMLELGPDAAALHREVGALAAEAGVDHVWAIGDHAADIVDGARRGGTEASSTTVEEASALVLGPDDVILVKASRGLALERVADAVLAAAPSAG